MKIEIDTDELAEFYDKKWHEDISSAEDLRSFLANFCKQKIEGEEEAADEEEEQSTKNESYPKFDSITYFTKDQAQKHLDLLRDEYVTCGNVTIRDCYRLAEWLQLIPKWTHLHFRADYGWKDLSTARVKAIHRGGIDLWILEMPVVEKLSKG